jgi:hypothetical protein
MKRYEPTLPRTASGMSAVAMTVLTFGLLVVAPAHVASQKSEAGTIVARKADSPAPVEVAIDPARIDVVAQRDQRTAFGVVRHLPGRKGAAS